MNYIQLKDGDDLPDISYLRPFLAVVIVDMEVTSEWQWAISKWLVDTGCLFMMAWGPTSSSWDDSVDYANLEAFNYEDIPDEAFVMTTWHDHEPLKQTFRFAKHSCNHPDVGLQNSVILDLHPVDRRYSIVQDWEDA